MDMSHWVDAYSVSQQTIILNDYLYRKNLESFSFLNGQQPRIYYYVGQSNCRAVPIADLPGDLAGDIVGCYELQYVISNNVVYQDYELKNLSSRSDTSFGPILRIGKLLYAYYNVPIIFVSCYRGGTGLAQAAGATPDFNAASVQKMYYELKQKRTALLNYLSVFGVTPTESGVIWIQGEQDMQSDADSLAYQTNMQAFIDTWRTDIGHANAKFYLSKMTLPTPQYNATWIARVRDAMDAIATGDVNVKAIETNTYSRYDGIHLDEAGCEDYSDAMYTQLIL